MKDDIIDSILETYGKSDTPIHHLSEYSLPDREVILSILDNLFEIIFPGYFWEENLSPESLRYHTGHKLDKLREKLTEQVYRATLHECQRRDQKECAHCREFAESVSKDLLEFIPELRRLLSLDVEAAYEGDPAAKSYDEVIFSYPCLYAITVYRIANFLTRNGVILLPRIMTEYAHNHTGIDIHPGASIGESFFIDHGTGVVIGETTVIGDNVKIYQGVTLGAMSFPRDEKGNLIRGRKRHPTIEDNVVIYAHATILGGDTTIGEDSVIGGNVWLTESVPPRTKIIMKEPSSRRIDMS